MLTIQEHQQSIRDAKTGRIPDGWPVKIAAIQITIKFDEYEAAVRAALADYPTHAGFWLSMALGYHFFCQDEVRKFELAEDAYDHVLEIVNEEDNAYTHVVPLLTLLYWRQAQKVASATGDSPDYQLARQVWTKRVSDWSRYMDDLLEPAWWTLGFLEMIPDVTPTDYLWREYHEYGVNLESEDTEEAVVAFAHALQQYGARPATRVYEVDARDEWIEYLDYCNLVLQFLYNYADYVEGCRSWYRREVQDLIDGIEFEIKRRHVQLWSEDTSIYAVIGGKYRASASSPDDWIEAFKFVDSEHSLDLFAYLVEQAQKRAWSPDSPPDFTQALAAFIRLYPELECDPQILQLIRDSIAANLCAPDEISTGWLLYAAGKISLQFDQHHAASQYLQQAHSVIGDVPELLRLLATALLQTNDTLAAITIIDRLGSVAPRDPLVSTLSAKLHELSQQHDPQPIVEKLDTLGLVVTELGETISDKLDQIQIDYARSQPPLVETDRIASDVAEKVTRQLQEIIKPESRSVLADISLRCERNLAPIWKSLPESLRHDVVDSELLYNTLTAGPINDYRYLVLNLSTLAEICLRTCFVQPLGEVLDKRGDVRSLLVTSLEHGNTSNSDIRRERDWKTDLERKNLADFEGLLRGAHTIAVRHTNGKSSVPVDNPVAYFLQQYTPDAVDYWLNQVPRAIADIRQLRNPAAHNPVRRFTPNEVDTVRSILHSQAFLFNAGMLYRGYVAQKQ